MNKAESRKQKNYVSYESRVKCLGFIEKGTGKHQSNCVYSVEGLSPTICAGLGVKMPGLYIVVDN